MKQILIFCLLSGSLLAQNSRLAEGRFFKITVSKRGIHKITPQFIASMGINPSSLNPQKIRLFAGHQGMLPQPNAHARVSDLVEVPLWAQGEADQRFDESDYFLFFAESPHKQVFDTKESIFVHVQNIYSDQNFYFLEIESPQKGQRIAVKDDQVSPGQVIEFYDEHIWHEKEEVNILQSGRSWYGEQFGFVKNLAFSHNITGINPNADVRCKLAVMGQSFEDSRFSLTINGTKAGELAVPPIFPGTYSPKGEEAKQIFYVNLPSSNRLNISIDYLSTSGSARLDYFDLNFSAPLRLLGDELIFRSIESTQFPSVIFKIQNASGCQVWDVTDPLSPYQVSSQVSANQLEIKVKTQSLREFVAFRGSDFALPVYVGAVPNQNLHALEPSDLLIIVPDIFRAQAERLAEFRRKYDGLSVLVVSPEQVYNEFSSGRQDLVALRDFVRLLYQKSGLARLRYVLLFGDASYDYKNRLARNTNFVPVYESEKSLHPIFSYSSDDFIGLLDEREGVWGDFDNETLDLGIGRLPAANLAEAKTMVDKLIAYSSDPESMGDWRKVISFVADDGDNNLHQLQADRLATMVDTNYLNINVKKFYVDAYPQESDGGERRSPILRNVLNNRVNSGSLIVNFTGHGAEYGWTSEGILDISSIKSWRNAKRLPFFLTATCEFGRYDDPAKRSGAEEILIHPDGGGIGLITTTRPVFANTNYIVNEAFYRHALRPMPNGEMPRLGDLVRLTKNASMSGDINRNFALLGDPSMRLAYPKNRVVIKEINGKAFSPKDTLSALQLVSLRGEIQDSEGNKKTDFDGVVSLQLFEKQILRTTLGDEGPTMDFKERVNTIFRGTASVKGGEYEFKFLIPKDINYQFGQARLSFYAMSAHEDAASDNGRLILGGGLQQYTPDNTPPQIRLYLENQNFSNGQTVRATPLLIAELFDESGINIGGMGVGRNLMAIIDDDQDRPLLLNALYQTELDDFTHGSVRYQFLNEEALAPGHHTIRLIAWDNHNNFAQQEIYFKVAGKKEAAITQILTYPNPATDKVFVTLCHNLAGNEILFEASLFSADGRQLAQWQNRISENMPCIENLSLDMNSVSNDRLTGFFFLKVIISSSSTSAESVQRLIIINK